MSKTMTLQEKHKEDFKEFYESGVLDPDFHFQLVESLIQYSAEARVRPEFICGSMMNWCAEEEIQWVADLRSHRDRGVYGLVFVNQKNTDDRMSGIGGALLRNYIGTRIITLAELCRVTKDGPAPDPTVLMVPNLVSDIADWQKTNVTNVLYDRYYAGRQTILAIPSFELLQNLYGQACADHIRTNYQKIG